MGDRFPGYAVLVRNQSPRSTELLSGMGMSTGQEAMIGKVTVGQASHWPLVIDSVVGPVGSYGLNGLKKEAARLHHLKSVCTLYRIPFSRCRAACNNVARRALSLSRLIDLLVIYRCGDVCNLKCWQFVLRVTANSAMYHRYR